MKARRRQLCFECGYDIDVGEHVVMRTVMGERRPAHAFHFDLPTRHIRNYGERWGSLRNDPTIPKPAGLKGGTRKQNKRPVIATLKGERVYVGKAHDRAHGLRMLGEFYRANCTDSDCHHFECKKQRQTAC